MLCPERRVQGVVHDRDDAVGELTDRHSLQVADVQRACYASQEPVGPEIPSASSTITKPHPMAFPQGAQCRPRTLRNQGDTAQSRPQQRPKDREEREKKWDSRDRNMQSTSKKQQETLTSRTQALQPAPARWW